MINFYRYEFVRYASLDIDGDYISNRYLTNVKVELRILNMWKETPKGYWIGYGYQNDKSLKSVGKWVSKTSKKRYAYPTKKEALINFIKRTERRKEILDYRSDDCRDALSIAEILLNKELENTI